MFSKACEYAIRASLFIKTESKQKRKTSLKNIADAIDSPEAFTAKILQKLVQADLIGSSKGPKGGFYIPQKKKIYLSSIVDAIDGDSIYKGCALGLPKCSEDHPCPVHFDFLNIRNDLKEMLENTTLEELSKKLESGESFLKL